MDVAGGLLTYAEAGRELNVSRQRIWELVRQGRLGRVTKGGRDYVSAKAVLERRKLLGMEELERRAGTKGER